MKELKNRENEKVTLSDGRVVFLSRSVALVGLVACVVDATINVLMVRRGPMLDSPGKWCMPCGYLDWDETIDDGVRREIWEESGLDIDSLPNEEINSPLFNREVPYRIDSSPLSNRQNITHHYVFAFFGPLPELTTSHGKDSGEIADMAWVDVSKMSKDTDLYAFGHYEIIKGFISENMTW